MANNLDTTFQALADPTRRAVLARLSEAPASVTDLAASHKMALPSFLAHIRKLEAAGLVTTEKTGRTRICALSPAQLDRAADWLDRVRRDWEGRLDRLEAHLAATDTPKTDP